MNKFKKSGVYCIKNLKNGKVYVGSSKNLEHRRTEHFNSLLKGNHHCSHLQKSYNKYGLKYFIFCVIEYVEGKNKLEQQELRWFHYYNVGNHSKCYNTCFYVGSPRGIRHSEETKRKLSAARKGKKFTEEHKRHLSESNKGQKRTEEQRKHLREAILKRGFTDAQRCALKKRNDTYKKGHNPNAKRVICVETMEVFETLNEALEFSKGKDRAALSRSCKNRIPYRGKHYLFLKDFRKLTHIELKKLLLVKSKWSIHVHTHIKCIEDEKEFRSISDASKYYHVSRDTISKYLKLKKTIPKQNLTFIKL